MLVSLGHLSLSLFLFYLLDIIPLGLGQLWRVVELQVSDNSSDILDHKEELSRTSNYNTKRAQIRLTATRRAVTPKWNKNNNVLSNNLLSKYLHSKNHTRLLSTRIFLWQRINEPWLAFHLTGLSAATSCCFHLYPVSKNVQQEGYWQEARPNHRQRGLDYD